MFRMPHHAVTGLKSGWFTPSIYSWGSCVCVCTHACTAKSAVYIPLSLPTQQCNYGQVSGLKCDCMGSTLSAEWLTERAQHSTSLETCSLNPTCHWSWVQAGGLPVTHHCCWDSVSSETFVLGSGDGGRLFLSSSSCCLRTSSSSNWGRTPWCLAEPQTLPLLRKGLQVSPICVFYTGSHRMTWSFDILSRSSFRS